MGLKDAADAILSGCNDVLVSRAPDGTLRSTSFCVRFGRLKVRSRLKKNRGKVVRLACNGEMTDVYMMVMGGGECAFVDKKDLPKEKEGEDDDSDAERADDSPSADKCSSSLAYDEQERVRSLGLGHDRKSVPSHDTLKKLNLKPGRNDVTFLVDTSLRGEQRLACRVYLLPWQTKFVVSDVDGTITKSNVGGQVANALGKDFTHNGIARFYSQLADKGYQMIYLTSRSITMNRSTREYIDSVVQRYDVTDKGRIDIGSCKSKAVSEAKQQEKARKVAKKLAKAQQKGDRERPTLEIVPASPPASPNLRQGRRSSLSHSSPPISAAPGSTGARQSSTEPESPFMPPAPHTNFDGTGEVSPGHAPGIDDCTLTPLHVDSPGGAVKSQTEGSPNNPARHTSSLNPSFGTSGDVLSPSDREPKKKQSKLTLGALTRWAKWPKADQKDGRGNSVFSTGTGGTSVPATPLDGLGVDDRTASHGGASSAGNGPRPAHFDPQPCPGGGSAGNGPRPAHFDPQPCPGGGSPLACSALSPPRSPPDGPGSPANLQAKTYSAGFGQFWKRRGKVEANRVEYRLPPGPVIACPDFVLQTLVREVVKKQAHMFKTPALLEVLSIFDYKPNPPRLSPGSDILAQQLDSIGVKVAQPGEDGSFDHLNTPEAADNQAKHPFLAAFGNAPTDKLAYYCVGVPLDQIYIVNPKSEIRSGNRCEMLKDLSKSEYDRCDRELIVTRWEEMDAQLYPTCPNALPPESPTRSPFSLDQSPVSYANETLPQCCSDNHTVEETPIAAAGARSFDSVPQIASRATSSTQECGGSSGLPSFASPGVDATTTPVAGSPAGSPRFATMAAGTPVASPAGSPGHTAGTPVAGKSDVHPPEPYLHVHPEMGSL